MGKASLDELLEFANAVRKVGGAEPIDKLLPGFPADSQSCLVARNLNFDCRVFVRGGNWLVELPPSQGFLHLRLAEWCLIPHPGGYGYLLPHPIARIASDFDKAGRLFAPRHPRDPRRFLPRYRKFKPLIRWS